MLSSKPEISVLVPIFNVKHYLRKCLDSIQNQTFKSIEVICINDGSTDGSREIIEEYLSDERFRVIDKLNSGYGASMNRGLEEARGEYIAILESDDFLDIFALERLHAIARCHDVDVVKANFYLYWSCPDERNEFFELITRSMTGRIVNPQIETEIFYLKPSIWSALYSASFIRDNEITFLETPGASYQDAGFNFKVWVSATRVCFVHDAYLHYRQDNESSSVNSPGKIYCVCDEYEEMDRYLDARPEKKLRFERIKVKMKFDSYMWNYDRLSNNLRSEFLERMFQDFDSHMSEGLVDLDLFEPWKVVDICTLLESPELFHSQRSAHLEISGFRRLMQYVRAGGFPLVFRALKSKCSRAL